MVVNLTPQFVSIYVNKSQKSWLELNILLSYLGDKGLAQAQFNAIQESQGTK